ncbi:GspE/PulE family protein [Sulfurimonas sp.]|uniref:GspE/PulE family protein n=1 Tax=Sulfurimonas sp. TaxID=2022749 RepID=UPI002AB26B37|nr:GspE/PulE family protein [Sulfurimonas sp.]
MRNLKIFEDELLKELIDKNIIDKKERNRLLRERIVKKTPLLQNIANSKEIETQSLLEILARLYDATILDNEDTIVVNDSLVADSLFKEHGAVLGKIDDTQAEFYLFEPIFDASWSSIESTLQKNCVRFIVTLDTYERISEDIKKNIEYKKNHAITSNEQLHSLPEDKVAILFADELLQKTLETKASDVHIEPKKDGFRVRFRINGMLQEFGEYEKEFFPLVSSRLKLLSGLNIAEKRDTQDGALVFKAIENDKEVDVPFRISVMPTIYGEKIVLRRLSGGDEVIRLDDLKMGDDISMYWKKAIKNPYGIILISGPTGSGKSTTLFAALNEINHSNINITTVEDPVEFKIPGVNQVQINSYKVSFATALRSILRQDPDVIMIGEIRDYETAEIALRASLTGHLVFSTIHTNDAASVVTRLIDMGVEPFLVASSLVGVLAQRLVRILCPECKQEHTLGFIECQRLSISKETVVYKAKGCRKCHNSGYVSRQGIYEFLIFDDHIKKMINNKTSDIEIRNYAIKTYGMPTILESAKKLMLSGDTSYEELIKVASE